LIESTGERVPKGRNLGRHWRILGGFLAVVSLAVGGWLIARGQAAESREAPEAQKVLEAQAAMPFQILIPGYLPRGFDREKMEIKTGTTGPGGEPMVQLGYYGKKGAPLFIREWLPVHSDQESLNASLPISTKWGPGWLLRQGKGLIALWVDIGPLRASIYSPSQEVVPAEILLAIADTMGPASNLRVTDSLAHPPTVREVVPPPLEIPINAEGVQEVDLIVSASGYSPAHFAVKKGVPVRVTFRQLGWVGCGSDITFPTGPDDYVELRLQSPTDKEVVEFTPQVAGEFRFSCTNLTYQGILTVRE
jgi:hypothetical protein